MPELVFRILAQWFWTRLLSLLGWLLRKPTRNTLDSPPPQHTIEKISSEPAISDVSDVSLQIPAKSTTGNPDYFLLENAHTTGGKVSKSAMDTLNHPTEPKDEEPAQPMPDNSSKLPVQVEKITDQYTIKPSLGVPIAHVHDHGIVKDVQSYSIVVTENTKYIIQPIPGKGLGIIATRPISEGQKILSEAPLFTQDLNLSEQAIARSMAPKTKEEKRQFIELTNSHRGKQPHLTGIFLTNALPCGVNDGMVGNLAARAGIFLQGSRFNSSCVPNVNNCWNEEKQTIAFHALRSISTGEELCISYGQTLAPRTTRRMELQTKFGFECHCAACSLSGNEQLASDRRRSAAKTLFDEIGTCGSQPAVGVKKVKTALRLLKEEGLIQYEGSLSYDAFQCCMIASDIIHAKAWIAKAWKASCISDGADSETSIRFRQYMSKPQEHPSWGAGDRMTLEGPDE